MYSSDRVLEISPNSADPDLNMQYVITEKTSLHFWVESLFSGLLGKSALRASRHEDSDMLKLAIPFIIFSVACSICLQKHVHQCHQHIHTARLNQTWAG